MTVPPRSRGRVLVTGSSGLIGTSLRVALQIMGFKTVGLDLRGRGRERGDVRVRPDLERAAKGVVGVVHLAAVSRVAEAHAQPALCLATNVEGTRSLLDVCGRAQDPPWVVYASSREVYGQPASFPVAEDAPLRPMNVYARSKVEAEVLCRESSLHTTALRFSNVYGSIHDHADRVVPAFARQAVEGHALRVDGRDHTFDFTHLTDTVRGIVAVVERMNAGEVVPSMHLVTGRPTTLAELADLAIELAGSRSVVREAEPRDFDVSGFWGDPTRARETLDWTAAVTIRTGLSWLIHDFRARSKPVTGHPAR